MPRDYQSSILQLLFCFIFYINFLVIGFTSGTASVATQTRILAFKKGSTFFYRMNYKINVVPHTTIFAQAAGFKVVWKLPDSTGSQNRRSVRDLHESVELLYKRHGINGKFCLIKSICDIEKYTTGKDGVVVKILKLLSRSNYRNETSIVDPLVCQRYANRCPLHLIGLNDFIEH